VGPELSQATTGRTNTEAQQGVRMTADRFGIVWQACANDFWAMLRDYAAPPPAAVLTQQVRF